MSNIIHSYSIDEAIEDGVLLELKNLHSKQFGRFILTEGIAFDVDENIAFSKFVQTCVKRHERHDWGEMEKEDIEANNSALKNGDRLFSSYKIPEKLSLDVQAEKVWIITECDRSATTILYPSEY